MSGRADIHRRLERLINRLDADFADATGRPIDDETTIPETWAWGLEHRRGLMARIMALQLAATEEHDDDIIEEDE